MFPHSAVAAADVEEYNRHASTEIEHIRDFIVLHYHVTEREDTPFWRYCRNMEIPASLAHRIALFRQTGRVFRVPNELFGRTPGSR
jgi:tryptophan halogenase